MVVREHAVVMDFVWGGGVGGSRNQIRVSSTGQGSRCAGSRVCSVLKTGVAVSSRLTWCSQSSCLRRTEVARGVSCRLTSLSGFAEETFFS